MGVLPKDVLERIRVQPGSGAGLASRDPAWKGGKVLKALAQDDRKDDAEAYLGGLVQQLSDLQERLWASDRYALLAVSRRWTPPGRTARSTTCSPA